MKKTFALLTGLCVSLHVPTAPAAEPLPLTNPPLPSVTLEDFKLAGELNGERAAFTITASARVENSKGATLELLSGPLALTEIGAHKQWNVRAESGRYLVVFEHGGKFPIKLKFDAAVRQNDNWKAVEFRIAPSALQPI